MSPLRTNVNESGEISLRVILGMKPKINVTACWRSFTFYNYSKKQRNVRS